MRQRNTNVDGGSFTLVQVEAVWSKGVAVSGYDPAQHRKDACGAWMTRSEYAKETQYGWEVDHEDALRAAAKAIQAGRAGGSG